MPCTARFCIPYTIEVVSGVAVTMVCFEGAGAGFWVEGFEPAPEIIFRTGGPQACERSGSGRCSIKPKAIGMTAVMCVSGP
eukprot:CAMPEP_0115619836 /NCGR_PEP_ID=MMETSP0272-20121206/24883_1 /TAXON_ID=71861 /ORGANISM="Scrippsiella trochoidea, Strain CCMP3099" /LENGTH=80 /DNA_ID=CAMNT_0003055871 /DNA_START=91 /DNA_END=333 /DNA_ORIENTATION=+